MNIYYYTLKRLLYVIPVILGVCLIIFILFNKVGGDPAQAILSKHATAEQMNDIRRELGLDKSAVEQYFDIVKSAFTFEFGRSWSTKQEISKMILQGAVPSLTISLPAFTISTLLAVLISLLIAFFRGTYIDKAAIFICVGLMSISSLAYILFGQYFFAYKLGLFEISGYEEGFPYFIPYVILPIIIWVVLTIGRDIRFYRTVLLDEIYQDYVRTARAKGVSESMIMLKHVLKNAMVPIITYVIIQIPFLILGALLLESFFGIPGLGGMTLNAINSSDFPVIRAVTILSSIAYIFFSVLTDVLYTVVDPRVRLN